MNKKLIGAGATVILLMAGAAAIASYTTRESLQPQTETNNLPIPPQPQKQPQRIAAAQPVQPAQPRCDDSNIVGTVAGGAVGGIAGSQIGNGSGKTAATIGGVLGGAFLGNRYIPTRNVTCQH